MFGQTEAYGITLLSIVAAFSDLFYRRIPNWLTLPAFLLGVFASIWVRGFWPGLSFSLLGGFVGLLLFGWMFFFRFMGGGDVKFLMALGAWGGSRYAVEVAILSVLLGGLFAAFILLAKGMLRSFLRRLYRFILTVFVRELAVEFPDLDRKSKMPFGLPIAIAAVWNVFGSPLEQLGVRLW